MAEGLARHLSALIAAQGPLPVSLYIAECLGNPRYGYYMTRDPLGRGGDFTTAPEISQMFGELVGLWLATVWQSMGAPDPVNVVELGPGRGTLMADALRAAKALPPFHRALRLHLVETSPVLRRHQAEALSDISPSEPLWHDRFDDVPEGPLLVVANEFFDALPIRQFVRTAQGWCERLVDMDPAQPDRFRFVTTAEPVPVEGLLEPGVATAPEGSIAEVGPAGQAIAAALAERIQRCGGAALIVDYGHARSAAGDTLQAVRDHTFHPVLDRPGTADITAHIDFAALARAARGSGAAVAGPMEQGAFLRALGIETRAEMLAARATPRQQADIATALRRLTAPDAMGSLFKAMAVVHPGLPCPPGFEAQRT